jgi:hypothetical protein
VTNFCGLHANVPGEIVQVVHGVADDLLARMRELGGLNEPHLIFGRIHAQAYDTAAFKCAADALLLEAGVELLFHAFAVGVARAGDDDRGAAARDQVRPGRGARRTFIDCSGDGDLAHFAGVATEKGDAGGALLYPTLMFRVGNVDAARAAKPGEPSPSAWTQPRPRASSASRGAARSSGRRSMLRVAGQRHPAEERRRQRHRWHRCALALRGEVEGRRQASTTCVSCARRCRGSKRPMPSRSRRSSASARRGAWRAKRS